MSNEGKGETALQPTSTRFCRIKGSIAGVLGAERIDKTYDILYITGQVRRSIVLFRSLGNWSMTVVPAPDLAFTRSSRRQIRDRFRQGQTKSSLRCCAKRPTHKKRSKIREMVRLGCRSRYRCRIPLLRLSRAQCDLAPSVLNSRIINQLLTLVRRASRLRRLSLPSQLIVIWRLPRSLRISRDSFERGAIAKRRTFTLPVRARPAMRAIIDDPDSARIGHADRYGLYCWRARACRATRLRRECWPTASHHGQVAENVRAG